MPARSARPLDDVQECSDGTVFSVHSELVRGEPRFYWPQRRPPGADASMRVAGGSYDRRTVQRQIRRLADEHDEELR